MTNIIFDYDGTLHETSYIYYPAFLSAYKYLVESGYRQKRNFEVKEVTKWLGYNKYEMWESFGPDLPKEVKDHASDIIGEEMIHLIKNGTARLYPGIEETLTKLVKDGYRLIFLSNCKNIYMETHRKKFNLDRFFTDYFCAEDYNFKPKYEIFKDLKSNYQGEYIVVGDRFHDIEMAKKHNLLSIGAGYGYSQDGELKSADYIITSPGDLYPTIKKLKQ